MATSTKQTRTTKMTNNTTYNGWTNYETWKVNLELVDGRGYEEVAEYYASEGVEDVVGLLADCIQEQVEELVFEDIPDNSFASGVVYDTLSKVNWLEIAEHYVEEA